MNPLRLQALTLLALSSLASAAAFAGTGTDAVRTGHERISLAGLDLTTRDGVRAARQRIVSTAQHLCTRLAGLDGPENHEEYASCLQGAISGAELKLAQLLRVSAPALVDELPARRLGSSP